MSAASCHKCTSCHKSKPVDAFPVENRQRRATCQDCLKRKRTVTATPAPAGHRHCKSCNKCSPLSSFNGENKTCSCCLHRKRKAKDEREAGVAPAGGKWCSSKKYCPINDFDPEYATCRNHLARLGPIPAVSVPGFPASTAANITLPASSVERPSAGEGNAEHEMDQMLCHLVSQGQGDLLA